jgi:hypothetical protein
MSWQTVGLLKAVLCTCAIGIALLWYLLHRLGTQAYRGHARISCIVILLMGAAAYFDFGRFHGNKYPHTIHWYDFYHYYMGAKYYPEVLYDGIYSATVVADDEDQRFFRSIGVDHIRDLKHDAMQPVAEVLRQKEKVRARFSEQRWAEFKKDLAFFQTNIPRQHWQDMLSDFGFNGPPGWALAGGVLSRLSNTQHFWQIAALAWLDVAMMIAAFVFVYRAFGFHVTAIAVVFFGVNYTARYDMNGGSFLRLDWLASLLIGVSLLKLGRYRASGFFVAYSAFLRIFPVLYVGGVIVRLLYGLCRPLPYDPNKAEATSPSPDSRKSVKSAQSADRISAQSAGLSLLSRLRGLRIPRPEGAFLGSFILSSAVLVVLTFMQPGGAKAWPAFRDHIVHHSQRLTVKRIALPYLFAYMGESSIGDLNIQGPDRWDQFYKMRQERLDRFKWPIWAIRGLVLVLFVYVCLRCSLTEAALLGIVLVFFFTNPVRYYYAQLIVLILLLGPRLESAGAVWLMASLFALMITMNAINATTGSYNIHQFVLSLWLGLLLVSVMGWFAFRQRAGAAGRADVPALAQPAAV